MIPGRLRGQHNNPAYMLIRQKPITAAAPSPGKNKILQTYYIRVHTYYTELVVKKYISRTVFFPRDVTRLSGFSRSRYFLQWYLLT